MASSGGGVTFLMGLVRHCSLNHLSHIRWRCSGKQVVSGQWMCGTRHLSRPAWAPAPPNSLRYQHIALPALSNPHQHVSLLKEQWEESHTVCLLVSPGDANALHSLTRLSLFRQPTARELYFFLTTVDGSREDNISVDTLKTREHGCFRSLFETELCPAPYMYGSTFYCFHCPTTRLHLVHGHACEAGSGMLRGHGVAPAEAPSLRHVSLCNAPSRAERECADGDGDEEEEKLSLMFERLRVELPSFFMTKHDYSMYSEDVEFINGLINVKTRGRVLYHLTLSSWRLLCLCYYAEARLDVLKLTKHTEDGTIKARWRIKGLPFHSLLFHFLCKDKSHLYRSYDAFSTFYLGPDGLIHCHKVEKVMPARPPLLPRVTSFLAGALVALGLQENRPALNLLPLLLSSLRQNRK
ncbi:uncharacterized protein C6orf136 homolog [Gouania willdenowi]|uniref:Uncharacterized protein n=1 Tax=Gouania willdenowi TaxID=441366 RepID=A0A8C5DET1_GOUWI|nr:uncharacterized protein C6orf136 homolog [Gouania willdenowi]XP_028316444.1 uncharacterized protein C6orf136 homolog [Gouania willdenowi]XP_028316445.1 uncharacterized protein C6orf136 homolog [Gouania willdenowi]